MYKENEGSEGDAQERQSSEVPKRPMYENLFDVPVVVFCQFIAEMENITETDITNWSNALDPLRATVGLLMQNTKFMRGGKRGRKVESNPLIC